MENIKSLSSRSWTLLGSALALTMVNQFVVEPATTANMFERYRLDDKPGAIDTDEYKKLKKQFGMLHGLSSLGNLVAFCGGVAHAFCLASALVGE